MNKRELFHKYNILNKINMCAYLDMYLPYNDKIFIY